MDEVIVCGHPLLLAGDGAPFDALWVSLPSYPCGPILSFFFILPRGLGTAQSPCSGVPFSWDLCLCLCTVSVERQVDGLTGVRARGVRSSIKLRGAPPPGEMGSKRKCNPISNTPVHGNCISCLRVAEEAHKSKHRRDIFFPCEV